MAEAKGMQETALSASEILSTCGADKSPSGLSRVQIEKCLSGMLENRKTNIDEAAANQDVEKVREQIALLADTMTEKDCRILSREGFDPGNTEVDTIVTVVDKIRISLAAGGEVLPGGLTDVDMEQIRKFTGNAQMAQSIAKKMKEKNLPVTEDAVREALTAAEMAESLTTVKEETAGYLLSNGLEPTIENLYKAEHSGASGKRQSGKAISMMAGGQMETQVKKVIESAGYQADRAAMSDAGWMLENGLELTAESFRTMEEYKAIVIPREPEELAENIANAIAGGKKAVQTLLTGEQDLFRRAEAAVEILKNADDQSIRILINSGNEINIRNLSKAGSEDSRGPDNLGTAQGDALSDSQTVQDEGGMQFLTAKRRLEELRLQMTLQSSIGLLKRGIIIETEPLEKLVDELKVMEEEYYKKLLSGPQKEISQESISLFKETCATAEGLKNLPCGILGSISARASLPGVKALYAEGKALQADYEKANASYETLMTRPRSDMGDSISKAFGNIDSLLEGMGLETTESNRRAARILGYNSMELTKDSIASVREADACVNRLIRNLTPAAALELIRKDINPLEMKIDELNGEIEKINGEKPGLENQKYSEFLWKLEQNESITEAERSSFIGIYRLISQIEKTGGRAIGSVLDQGVGMSLKNLLKGVRQAGSKGIDASVDGGFGALEGTVRKGISISDQINEGFSKSPGNSYYAGLAEQMLGEITPSGLNDLMKESDFLNIPFEEAAWRISEQAIGRGKEEAEDSGYYSSRLEQLRDLKHAETAAVRLLTDYGQPVTAGSLIAAGNMTSAPGSTFRKLLKAAKEYGEADGGGDKGFSDKGLKEALAGIGESLGSPEMAEKAYENLSEYAEKILGAAAAEEAVTSVNLRELQALHHEVALARNLGRREKYEIPIINGDNISAMRLTVIRGGEAAGSIKAVTDGGSAGRTAAEFFVGKDGITGYIAAEQEESLAALKNMQAELEKQMPDGRGSVHIEYVQVKNLDVTRFDLMTGKTMKKEAASEQKETGVSTERLYEVAKTFVSMVRTMEAEASQI